MPARARGVVDVRCRAPHRLTAPAADAVTHDQRPVQQLTTHRANPPLRVGVRPRRPYRRRQGSDALRGEDGIEGVGELRVPVTEEELELDLPGAVCQIHEQVAGLLGHHARVGLAVTPKTCTPRVDSSIMNNTCRRLSSTVSTWKQVAGQDSSRPGRTGTVATSAPARRVPGRCPPGGEPATRYSARSWTRAG
jgi:hypothetical protein